MIKTYENHLDFLDIYGDYLQYDEIRYSLFLGISKRNTNTTLLVSSQIDDAFVLGLLAGKNLILASNTLNEEVYLDLIDYMETTNYPGIIGSKEHCELYSSLYKNLTGKELQTVMDQRIYACYKVNNYSEDIGTVRPATLKDLDILKTWAYNFYVDVDEDVTLEYAKKQTEAKIEAQTVFVLEVDNEVVSMAARARLLIKTQTVGFVYTPVEHRKKGYASRVVEEVTRYIHKDNKIATLYTDLSNPTSNSIYIKIGYNPHCDSVMMEK